METLRIAEQLLTIGSELIRLGNTIITQINSEQPSILEPEPEEPVKKVRKTRAKKQDLIILEPESEPEPVKNGKKRKMQFWDDGKVGKGEKTPKVDLVDRDRPKAQKITVRCTECNELVSTLPTHASGRGSFKCDSCLLSKVRE